MYGNVNYCKLHLSQGEKYLNLTVAVLEVFRSFNLLHWKESLGNILWSYTKIAWNKHLNFARITLTPNLTPYPQYYLLAAIILESHFKFINFPILLTSFLNFSTQHSLWYGFHHIFFSYNIYFFNLTA